ncbi:MAG TPA: hypothetical protein VK787_11205 [Puia sp.]|nr:hypothetical protein [Puia sp.]
MRKHTILIGLCMSFTLFQFSLSAQDSLARQKFLKDSIEKEMDSVFNDAGFFKPKSFWLANINYLSNNVYLGRKDSVPSPYFTASVGYYDKSGFFVNASASYLTKPGQERIDLATIDGGYSLIKTKFEGLITISKYIFSSESYNVRSEIEGSANIFVAYDFGFIKPTLQGTLNFGDNTDFAAGLGLEHTFYAAQKNLTITPTFDANASTQNYYNNYYKIRRYSVRRPILKAVRLQRLLNEISISGYVENPGEFKILDYEWSIPVTYSVKRFTFSFSPSYTVPTNAAVVDVTIVSARLGTRTKERGKEQLTNSFFFITGVSYSF